MKVRSLIGTLWISTLMEMSDLEDSPRGTYWHARISYEKCFKELPKDSTLSAHEISEICRKDPRETKKYLDLLEGKDLGGRKIIGKMIPEKKYYVDPPAEDRNGGANILLGLAILGLCSLPLWLPRLVSNFSGGRSPLHCPLCSKSYALSSQSTVTHIGSRKIWFSCDCATRDISYSPNQFHCSCQRIL